MKKRILLAVLLLVTAAFTAQANSLEPREAMERDSIHAIIISPDIQNGTVTIRPAQMAMEGERVTISATPAPDFVVLYVSVANYNDPDELVDVVDMTFNMPTFDVLVDVTFTPLNNGPVILNDIVAPAAICAGGTLELTPPQVMYATRMEWQISADKNFVSYEVYTNQALDRSYNGWKLRYMASNSMGTVYSNVVNITVNSLGALNLTGDLSACTRQESTYTVAGASNVKYTWEVTDPNASIEGSGKSVKILWGAAGRQVVTVTVEDEKLGCTETLEMEVAIQSFVKESDLNAIVAKKHEGDEYLLIYPNPKDTHYRYQWFKDGTPIEGATKQYYYPKKGLEAGEYQVYISFNADENGHLICGAFTPVFTLAVEREAFTVLPNPSQTGQELLLDTEVEGEALFTVFTLDGRMVFQQIVTGNRPTVQLNLAKGLYIGRLSQGDDLEEVAKIVIQ